MLIYTTRVYITQYKVGGKKTEAFIKQLIFTFTTNAIWMGTRNG